MAALEQGATSAPAPLRSLRDFERLDGAEDTQDLEVAE